MPTKIGVEKQIFLVQFRYKFLVIGHTTFSNCKCLFQQFVCNSNKSHFLSLIADRIDKYFPDLVELYPNANYKGIKSKAELRLKKSESNKIKFSLTRLIELLDSKKEKTNRS